MKTVLYTLGHGDRTREELLECLSSFGIRTVADVRSYPVSRRHPHFGRDELEPALAKEGYLYRWLGGELGGLRSDGYEVHMGTDLFGQGLAKLMKLAPESPTAILCAERDPAGCHRRHIARALRERGFEVQHMIDPGRVLLPGERPEDQGTLFDL